MVKNLTKVATHKKTRPKLQINIMCGIAGSKNHELVEKLMEAQSHRGSSQSINEGNYSFGHILHSIIGEVEQPLEEEGLLIANCEIYNWEELAEKHNIDSKNDADLLLKILDMKGVDILEELDGIYAFAYKKGDKIILARDKLGINPIWYHKSEDDFIFASEKQAIEKQGYQPRELHPRQILTYNIQENSLEFKQRDFFELGNETDKDIDEVAEEVKEKFLEAVEKRIPEKVVGVLFSGGLDSTLVAAALQELGKDFTAYTASIQHGNTSKPRDLEWAEQAAEEMNIELEAYDASLEDVEETIPKIVDWISSSNVIKASVALPIHFSLQGDEKVVFTGLGSEQLYAGYSRQQGYLNKECLSDLRSMYHEDLYRDNVLAFRNGYELRVPFLDQDLIEHALKIPADYKHSEDLKKYVLRLAAEKIGVPEDIVWRKKVAAQYGSNFDKAINKLKKDSGFDQKQKYLNQYRDSENKKLVALSSGGKDSNAALFRMWRRNNEISCILNIQSENKDSYMFDSKEKSIVEKHGEKLGIPVIIQKTKGEKEKELDDLLEGLRKAKEEYNVDGVVAGAIESSYQRDRVDKVAEQLGLKVFAPLWQFNQRHYMNWLVREGFEVEITEVAARGLDESWDGQILDQETVEDLLELAEEYRFNPAGEGGEYETKVLGFPKELLN